LKLDALLEQYVKLLVQSWEITDSLKLSLITRQKIKHILWKCKWLRN